ncbi:MAG TPA: sulfur carrier protein ThiS [Candidatus Aquilonibacter sp.]|nr:sulfur carrier protein ThiS [Candidatus Aquilonibacter sp.]
MELALHLVINGVPRTLEGLGSPTPLAAVLERLEMRPDRVAVELNSEIAPRTQWNELTIKDGDRVEIVHFVGGGRE